MATGETDGPRCRCLAPLERTKSNVKLISIQSESDRIEIQLDIRGGGFPGAGGGCGSARAGGRAGGRGHVYRVFGRNSEGIRRVFGSKKRYSDKPMFPDLMNRTGGASKVLFRIRARVCPL